MDQALVENLLPDPPQTQGINPEGHTEDACDGKEEDETLITPTWVAR